MIEHLLANPPHVLGSYASIAGFLLALIGFGVTIRNLRRIRRGFRLRLLANETEEATAVAGELLMAIHDKEWKNAHSLCESLAERLAKLLRIRTP